MRNHVQRTAPHKSIMARRKRHSIEGREETGYGGGFALLVVLVLIGGVIYSMFSGPPPKPPADASNLLAQSILALESVNKESFTFDGTLRISSGVDNMELPISGEGRIDLANQRMSLKLNIGPDLGTGPGTDDVLTIETYTIGNTVYSGIMGKWSKYPLDTAWSGSKFSRKIIDMARNLDTSIGKRETVNGKETIRVDVDATVEDLLDLLATMQAAPLDATAEKLAAGIRNIGMVIWIDANDFLPVKTSLSFTIEGREINLFGGGVNKSGVSLDININFDFKTPFHIILPSAARRAESITI